MPKNPMELMLEAQDREFKQRVRGRYYAALREGHDKETAAAYANDPDAKMPEAPSHTMPTPKVVTPPMADEDRAPAAATMPEPTPKEIKEAQENEVYQQPFAAEPAEVDADDFSKINGVGPKVKKQLIDMGYTKFDQIAAWSEDDAKKMDSELKLKGRVLREDWVKQAKALME